MHQSDDKSEVDRDHHDMSQPGLDLGTLYRTRMRASKNRLAQKYGQTHGEIFDRCQNFDIFWHAQIEAKWANKNNKKL